MHKSVSMVMFTDLMSLGVYLTSVGDQEVQCCEQILPTEGMPEES